MTMNTQTGANTFFKGLLVAAMIAGGGLITSSAHAINAPTQTVSVKIDMRDLKTEKGVERVYKTLSYKAKTSCTTSGAKPISQKIEERACTERLLTEFVENIDHERLNAYHARMQAG